MEPRLVASEKRTAGPERRRHAAEAREVWEMCLLNLITGGRKQLPLVADVEGLQVHQSGGGEIRRGGCAGRAAAGRSSPDKWR
jgi:hypothetical protein